MTQDGSGSGHNADALIEQLQLQPHPEGGWYRETWRAPSVTGERAAGTAILFLLKAGEPSHWHRVDAEELWIWQAGDPLELRLAASDEAQVTSLRLGADVAGGEAPQGVVPTGHWQATRPLTPQNGAHGWSLVSCVVVPGFDFAGFELAPPGWEPGQGA
ncbi:cupin domain-containing protein [Erythrobacter sp.]|uniref:cupin domain-containing protein n=1 Tax=Erythrobacter sp. TaxID=1042 RepID=UPI001425FDE7|nr:cupin domain-containing protein [Erythrobacter sp.]QIQ85311.1 MAG: cupin domain-containing protein [Erythrobacter sp.]